MNNDHTNKQIEQIYQKNALEKSPKNLDDLIIFEAQNSCRPKQHRKWLYSISTAAVLVVSFSLLINIPYNDSEINSQTISAKKPAHKSEQEHSSEGTHYQESSEIHFKSIKQETIEAESSSEYITEHDSIHEQSDYIQKDMHTPLPRQSKNKSHNSIEEKPFNKSHIDNKVIENNDLSTDLTHLDQLIDTNQKKQALLLLKKLIKKYPDHDFDNYLNKISSNK